MQSELEFMRSFFFRRFHNSSSSAAAERTLSLFHIITFYYENFSPSFSAYNSTTADKRINSSRFLFFRFLRQSSLTQAAWIKNISSQFKYLYCSCIKTWFIKRHDQPLWGRVFFICFGCTFVGFPLVNLLLSTFLLSLMIPFFMQIFSLCLFPSLFLFMWFVDVGSSRISLCSVHLMCYVNTLNSFCAYCNRDRSRWGGWKKEEEMLYHFSFSIESLTWLEGKKESDKIELINTEIT